MKIAVRIAEFGNLLKARLALLAGRKDRARTALKAALRHNPNRFVSHFLLGRLYLLNRSTVKARREFDLAWQIDPERFERVYDRLRGRGLGFPDLYSDPARADEVSVSLRRRPERSCGDFRNEQERRRFESLPPISRDEILQIDWDRFQEQLQSDQDSA